VTGRLVLPPFAAGDWDEAAPLETAPAGWTANRVPNLSAWLPGDVVLVAAAADVTGLAVRAAQRLSRQAAIRAAASFTHAGFYVGGGQMIDLTPRDGVARRSVWHYCEKRAIALRRLRSPDGADLGKRIAIAADAHRGEPYSATAAILSKLIPGTWPDPNRLYCSTFVGLVVVEATEIALTRLPEHRPLHPATLAVHPALDAIELEWCPRRQPAARGRA
jgi:cell wall-associated NlpC family hydrolase